MKNFLLGVLAVFLGIVIGTGILCLTGDIKLSSVDDTQVIENDTLKRTCMGNLLSAEFSSAFEIVSIQEELSWEVDCVTAFKDIPQSAVANVTNVLLRTRQHVTIYDVIREYLQNKQIYDNIVPDAVIEDPGCENPDPDATNTTTPVDTSKLTASTTTNNVTPVDPDPVAGKNENSPSDSATTANK